MPFVPLDNDCLGSSTFQCSIRIQFQESRSTLDATIEQDESMLIYSVSPNSSLAYCLRVHRAVPHALSSFSVVNHTMGPLSSAVRTNIWNRFCFSRDAWPCPLRKLPWIRPLKLEGWDSARFSTLRSGHGYV